MQRCTYDISLPKIIVSPESTFINIHLGITLCRDCANVLAYLEGDYSHNFSYQSLSRLKISLSVALARFLMRTHAHETKNSTWNKQEINETKRSWNFINRSGTFRLQIAIRSTTLFCEEPHKKKHLNSVIRDIFFREKYFARRFASRGNISFPLFTQSSPRGF